jgi:hypothetical protein
MSLVNSVEHDCILVIPHGLVLNARCPNAALAIYANNLSSSSPIICPAQIWYYLEDFACAFRCERILRRNPEITPTHLEEIIEAVIAICNHNSWTRVAVVCHPNTSDYVRLLSACGLEAFVV